MKVSNIEVFNEVYEESALRNDMREDVEAKPFYIHDKFEDKYSKFSKEIEFVNFDEFKVGKIVTHFPLIDNKEYCVVYADNPYGSRNLLLVHEGEAYRHGNEAVLNELVRYYHFVKSKEVKHAILRVWKFLEI